jgi:hypothetical protein
LSSFGIGDIVSVSGTRQRDASKLRISEGRYSRMDWILLKAQVDALQETIGTTKVGLPTFRYDRTSDRIIVNAFVNPDWIKTATLESIKDTLNLNGIIYCGRPFLDDDALQVSHKDSQLKHCLVFFYTFEQISRKEDATFNESGLILK